MNAKEENHKWIICNGIKMRFLGVTVSGHLAYVDEEDKLHVPTEKSYKKKYESKDKNDNKQ